MKARYARKALASLARAEGDGPVLISVRGLKFGSIEVVVHDGPAVQIIRTEKLRIER